MGNSGVVSYGALVYAGRMKKGETVLILGAGGGLGVLAVQIAKQFGCKVIAVVNTGAGNEGKVEMLKRLGADIVIGYQEKGWEEKVRKATPDRQGVHLVYDSVGAVLNSIRCCRFGGRVVIVGFAGRGGNMEDLKVNRVLLKNISLVGYVSICLADQLDVVLMRTVALWRIESPIRRSCESSLEQIHADGRGGYNQACRIRRGLQRASRYSTCIGRSPPAQGLGSSGGQDI